MFEAPVARKSPKYCIKKKTGMSEKSSTFGPVGAGKSALVEHIKRALEAAEDVYHIADCPIREEPRDMQCGHTAGL